MAPFLQGLTEDVERKSARIWLTAAVLEANVADTEHFTTNSRMCSLLKGTPKTDQDR